MIKQAEKERAKTVFDIKQRQFNQRSSDAREHFYLLVLIKKCVITQKLQLLIK